MMAVGLDCITLKVKPYSKALLRDLPSHPFPSVWNQAEWKWWWSLFNENVFPAESKCTLPIQIISFCHNRYISVEPLQIWVTKRHNFDKWATLNEVLTNYQQCLDRTLPNGMILETKLFCMWKPARVRSVSLNRRHPSEPCGLFPTSTRENRTLK